MDDQHQQEKTLIAVLTSHDSPERNDSLARLLEKLCQSRGGREKLKNFHFLFTGGTFDRLIMGTQKPTIQPVNEDTLDILTSKCCITRLPYGLQGGVTVLAYLIVQRQCSIIWPFLTPFSTQFLNSENLALMRLCDLWHVKRLMNTGSVEEWFEKEAESDIHRNPQRCPPCLVLSGYGKECMPIPGPQSVYEIKRPNTFDFPESFENMTIALIAHDEMKARMVEFVIDYESELARFQRILTTGTTGREVEEATRDLKGKIHRYHSGPKGGDIEIATEILFGECHIVIFFIDPLHPHPHIEDIRVVFGACMIQDKVRMLTNEMQAREWMERVVKRG
jgi:methylglyoxal synthase